MKTQTVGREAEYKMPDKAAKSAAPDVSSAKSESEEEPSLAGDLLEEHTKGEGEASSVENVLAPAAPVGLDEVYTRTIVAQLAATIPSGAHRPGDRQTLLDDAVAAYKLMEPADPADSAISRFIVALTNIGMDSLKRATAGTGLPLSRERDIKLGIKAATTTADLIRVFDSRPGRKPNKVTVGQVNVQSGGQAIVGNVSHPKPEMRAPGSPDGSDDCEETA